MSHNLGMNAGRESDGCVVPAKCPNKGGGFTPAEGMEGRRPTKENTGQTAASQIQSWENASAELRRVRGAATRIPSSVSSFALRRHDSAVRAGCASKRPSGSVRGALGNRRPYRDCLAQSNAHHPQNGVLWLGLAKLGCPGARHKLTHCQ
jgi:hypothetical protein